MNPEQPARRKPGRPPSRTGPMKDIHVTVNTTDLAALESYCERHQIGTSEAIRQAIRLLTSEER